LGLVNTFPTKFRFSLTSISSSSFNVYKESGRVRISLPSNHNIFNFERLSNLSGREVKLHSESFSISRFFNVNIESGMKFIIFDDK